MRTRAAVLLGLLVLTTAPAGELWRLVRIIGETHMVVVDTVSLNEDDGYWQAIRTLCAGKRACRIMFWTDEAQVPAALPLTDAQAKAKVADWLYDESTGHRQLLRAYDIATESADCGGE